jgi:hypothetical protein
VLLATQKPKQPPHWYNLSAPSSPSSSGASQRGQGSWPAAAFHSHAGPPQAGQNLASLKVIAKQVGQTTVATREPQWPHTGESAVTGAPQLEQFVLDRMRSW